MALVKCYHIIQCMFIACSLKISQTFVLFSKKMFGQECFKRVIDITYQTQFFKIL